VTDDGFREFVTARYPELLRTAYLLTGGGHGAEDLVQNALLNVMRRWRRVDDPVPYVHRIMVNQVINGWRRSAHLRELLTAAVPDRSVRDDADTVVDRDRLLTALATLPARMRAVLVLRYFDDLSERDAAAVLGVSVGTVKSQTHLALRRLREAAPELAELLQEDSR